MIFAKNDFIKYLEANNLGSLIARAKSGAIKVPRSGKSGSNLMHINLGDPYDTLEELTTFLDTYFKTNKIDSIVYDRKTVPISNLSFDVIEPQLGSEPFYNPNKPGNTILSRTSNIYPTIVLRGIPEGSDEVVNLFGFITEPSKSSGYEEHLAEQRILQEALVAFYLNSLIHDTNSTRECCLLTGLSLDIENLVLEVICPPLVDKLSITDEDFLFDYPEDSSIDAYSYYVQAKTLYDYLIDELSALTNISVYQSIYNDVLTTNIKTAGAKYAFRSIGTNYLDKYSTSDIWLIDSNVYNQIKDLKEIDIEWLTNSDLYYPKIVGLSLKKDNTARRGAITTLLKEENFSDLEPIPFEYSLTYYPPSDSTSDALTTEFRTTEDVIEYVDYLEYGCSQGAYPVDIREDDNRYEGLYDDLSNILHICIDKLNEAIENTGAKEWALPKYQILTKESDVRDGSIKVKDIIKSKGYMIKLLVRLLLSFNEPENCNIPQNSLTTRPDVQYFMKAFNFGSGNTYRATDIQIPAYICSATGKNNFSVKQIAKWRDFINSYECKDQDLNVPILLRERLLNMTSTLSNIPINFIDNAVVGYSQIETLGKAVPLVVKDQKNPLLS